MLNTLFCAGVYPLKMTRMVLDVATLTDRITVLIRRNIIDLAPGYEPGSRLNPREMARQLGVSETPMKMALQELATFGLVEVLPRRGTYVNKLSRKDVAELITVRAGLEAMALRLIDGKFKPQTLGKMTDCVAKCQEALGQGESEKYRHYDAQFHLLIVQASGNRRLLQVYDSLTGSVQILDVYNPRYSSQQMESQREHQMLTDLFSEGDLQGSEQALLDHWARSQQRLLAAYAPYLIPEGR
jgi:DNA-binding GntR family transcriptional regulator